jgi:two-component system cell cycle response regulator DivK
MACILVIEDNPSNMKLAVFLFEKEGYEVVRAIDAEEGIRIARQRLPGFIPMGVQLPGMDGLAAMRLLKPTLQPATSKSSP